MVGPHGCFDVSLGSVHLALERLRIGRGQWRQHLDALVHVPAHDLRGLDVAGQEVCPGLGKLVATDVSRAGTAPLVLLRRQPQVLLCLADLWRIHPQLHHAERRAEVGQVAGILSFRQQLQGSLCQRDRVAHRAASGLQDAGVPVGRGPTDR